jgi:hypothetical protein
MSDVIAGLIVAVGLLVLALVALVRADRKDIPAVVRELAQWWRLWR